MKAALSTFSKAWNPVNSQEIRRQAETGLPVGQMAALSPGPAERVVVSLVDPAATPPPADPVVMPAVAEEAVEIHRVPDLVVMAASAAAMVGRKAALRRRAAEAAPDLVEPSSTIRGMSA